MKKFVTAILMTTSLTSFASGYTLNLSTKATGANDQNACELAMSSAVGEISLSALKSCLNHGHHLEEITFSRCKIEEFDYHYEATVIVQAHCKYYK